MSVSGPCPLPCPLVASMRVLIVADDVAMSDLLIEGLSHANMVPTLAQKGRHADLVLSAAQRCREHYDAVILGLSLPDLDGREVLKRMRDRGDPTPVLVLSGQSTMDDRVSALETGADDFLSEPLALPELVARLRAMSRRHRGWPSASPQLGNLTMDANSGHFKVAGAALTLRPRAREILEALFRRHGSCVSKDFLTNLSENGSSIEAIDIQISRLRRAISEAGANVSIRTVYGQGYCLELNSRNSDKLV